MIGCLWTCVHKQPINALYFESEHVLKFYNLEAWTGNRVSWTSTACAFCDRSTDVTSVSNTVHIRFVRYTSVTHTLVSRPLSVTCSVRMRSLRLPRRHSPPLRRLPQPDKHFCKFPVFSASVTFIRLYVTATLQRMSTILVKSLNTVLKKITNCTRKSFRIL